MNKIKHVINQISKNINKLLLKKLNNDLFGQFKIKNVPKFIIDKLVRNGWIIENNVFSIVKDIHYKEEIKQAIQDRKEYYSNLDTFEFVYFVFSIIFAIVSASSLYQLFFSGFFIFGLSSILLLIFFFNALISKQYGFLWIFLS